MFFGRRRRELERRVTQLECQLHEATGLSFLHQTQSDYWQRRAEKLIDAALARRGEIIEPTMQDLPKPANASGLAGMFAGLSVTEIDSSKRSSPTSPPGQAVSAGGIRPA